MKSLYRVMGAFIGVVLLLIFLMGSVNGLGWTLRADVPVPGDSPICREQFGIALPWQLDAVSIGTAPAPAGGDRGATLDVQEISCSASTHAVKPLRAEPEQKTRG